MGKYLLFLVWGIVAIFLALASITSESSSSILAEVEPQRYAVSFPKAVRVKELYVVPGQQVKKGDPLIKVERPDLLLDVENQQKKIALLSSHLQKKELQMENNLYLNEIQYDLRKKDLENQIRRARFNIEQRKAMTAGMEKLNFAKDNLPSDSLIKESFNLLVIEKEGLEEEHYLKRQEIRSVFDLESSSIQAEIEQLEKEIALLEKEESELIRYARVDGAIGSIYVEIEELVPSYTNILSVYEDNPTVIRAFTNEHDPVHIESGAIVSVESTNRQYQIKGEIIEVGSRIIEYPQRLRTFDQKPSWGRELFIKIPEESKFLNGEKVFVILEK